MPGIPLVARETTCSRGADQMCRQESRAQLSAEEEVAAEESLSIYCKPVELYNILQRRSIRNPSFLQRCLRYKIQAKNKKRIQMTVSLPATVNYGLQGQNLFPLRIILARPASSNEITENYDCFHFNRCCTLTSCAGDQAVSGIHAKFILPEMNKLSAEIKSGSLSVLFVSCVEASRDPMVASSSQSNVEGHCLLGKIPMELLLLSWEKSPNLNLGEKAEMLSTVEMRPYSVKPICLEENKCVSFQTAASSGTQSSLQQLQVVVSAEEVGARDRSAYDCYSYSDIPSSSLPHIMRLRTGNVIFNYKYYNNKLQKTEVTEDFTCPFCLVKCASFKGVRHHLTTSHDLFNFEFWVTEDYQAVNVSPKTDIWRTEIIADGVDPKLQTFLFCSRPLRRRRPKSLAQNAHHVHPLALDSNLPASFNELLDKTDGVSSAGPSHADPEFVPSLPGSNLAPPTMLQFAKTRKLSVERSDPKNRLQLQKRQFFHSHRAQPMALEQVLSDRDSEDEVDDDVADFEDRRMLDDFVDVTKDEKRIMHLWNSFVRKQRVLADGHTPWACEAFSRLHAQDLIQAPALLWCWRLFMIKLWNHGLLDARTMNNCNIILEKSWQQNQDNDDPMEAL
ncbi:OLC1v1027094C1 [Oldenlandia corymbosa var. corymbosa]|uniref:OLC1v1027094C1 n=1 Tax=Oldenlandia corymbosa var. corymbosa TaxID=529605 RepID=A0AAV1C958_OLDCO|nr:OLC1v1027094C1 [Oldenlandia corymbosa var. corymbosa]